MRQIILEITCNTMVTTHRIIIIPARMHATRLPGKPLLDIAGMPMITHVWHRAVQAQIGPVVVATDSPEIKQIITQAGGKAVLTDSDLPSGSDRIYAALCHIDPDKKFEHILNLQGDLPEIEPAYLHKLADLLAGGEWDLTTLVAPASKQEATLPQIVKVAVSWAEGGGQDDQIGADQIGAGKIGDGKIGTGQIGRALYFSRAAIPAGPAPFYHHIGLYGWHRYALERFVHLPPSPLERAEKLEQLRALEAGMQIGVGVMKKAIAGIDTEEDLQACRQRFVQKIPAPQTIT